MKKRLLTLLLALAMMLAAVACSQKANEAEIPAPLKVTEKGDISKAFVDDQSGACEIVYEFSSLKDFYVYMTTGSNDPEDYDDPPMLILRQNFAPEVFSQRYVPIDTIFQEFNKSLKDPSKISTRLSKPYFAYYYEEFVLVIERSANLYKGNTASDYYTAMAEAYKGILPFTSENISDFSTTEQALKAKESGYLKRALAGYEAVYEYKERQLQSVVLIVDDCLIRISRIIPSEKRDSAELFESFMNREANAAVTPFFSADEQEYKTALAKLVTGIRALEQLAQGPVVITPAPAITTAKAPAEETVEMPAETIEEEPKETTGETMAETMTVTTAPQSVPFIELHYHGNRNNSHKIYEGEEYFYLLELISRADGVKGESTMGYYGVPYTLVVHLSEDSEPFSFSLWTKTQYSVSNGEKDEYGYLYFLETDLSELYEYLEAKYPFSFWYGE